MHKIVNEEELNLVSGAGFFKFLIDSLLLGGKEDSFGGFILSGGCNKSRIEHNKSEPQSKFAFCFSCLLIQRPRLLLQLLLSCVMQ